MSLELLHRLPLSHGLQGRGEEVHERVEREDVNGVPSTSETPQGRQVREEVLERAEREEG